MVPTVKTELLVKQVFLVIIHRSQWIPLASAIHAHSDPKDQTDQSVPLALLDQKAPQAKLVCPAQMAKLAQPAILYLVPMANQVAQDPKATVVPMAQEEAKDQQEAKDQPELQDQQDQRVQPDQKEKTVDQVQLVAQDPMPRMENSEAEDHQAQLANPEHQAKMPHTAHAPDVPKHHKPSIMKKTTDFFAIFLFATLDYKISRFAQIMQNVMP
jgi:archaellum component FlaD/FlaE